MKKILFILILALPGKAYTQWINSITVFPTNPTITDSVYLIADCSFPYGSCDQHTQGVSQNGYNISSWALHCVGMLTMICGHSDTFSLGTLSAGTYHVSFHLDHGSLPFPCTPGIVAGPTDSMTFNVSFATQLPHLPEEKSEFSIYPNPCQNILYLNHCNRNSEKILVDLIGREVCRFYGNELNVESLKPGIYLLSCEKHIRKVVVE